MNEIDLDRLWSPFYLYYDTTYLMSWQLIVHHLRQCTIRVRITSLVYHFIVYLIEFDRL